MLPCRADGCTIWSGHAGPHWSVCQKCWWEDCRCEQIDRFNPLEHEDDPCHVCGQPSSRMCDHAPAKDDYIMTSVDGLTEEHLRWIGNTHEAFWRYLDAWEDGMNVSTQFQDDIEDRIEAGPPRTGVLVEIDKTDPCLPFLVRDEEEDYEEWVPLVSTISFILMEVI